MKNSFFLLFLLPVLLFTGCSSLDNRYAETASYEKSAAYDEYAAQSVPAFGEEAAPMAMESPAAPQEKPVERLRVYSGFGRLIVEDVDEAKTGISLLAEENDGYVEGIWGNVIIIRVPAELFHDLFEEVLAFGEVDYKKIETVDVTEYFTDVSARLEIAEKTRERLYILLEKTEDVEERLKILQEIRRLTEEIERIGNTLRNLEKQIAFSRIQVELQPRLSEDASLRQGIPFPWIANLDPLYPALEAMKNKPEVPLDESFAVFSEDAIYRAENTGGVRVRISRTTNKPEGDTAFWQEALTYHLSPFYAGTEPLEFQEGLYRGALFTSKDKDPFHYLVAQRVDGDDIHVLEAFFPNTTELDAAREMVFEAFEGMVLP